MIKESFKGVLRSDVKCLKNHVSSTKEEFFNVSLDVTKAGTITNALKQFFSESKTIKNYMCGECRAKVDITKKYDWTLMPDYLVLHLNRFDHSASKLNNHVAFEFGIVVNQVEYALYGIVEHLGSTIDFGHYIAYVMSSDNLWFKV
jgi:ubiquitin C-terminal hydrolase